MNANTTAGSGPRAGRREWVGLAILGLPTLLVSLDIGALFLALPHLSADLHASSVQQLWITDIYGFLMASFLVTMGTLGDRIGRRKLLLTGAGLFGLLSIVSAYAPNPEMLIVARALMGIAAATLMPSTLALISNMFRDPKQLGTAIAAWVSCLMVGAAVGPVVGGALLSQFWWGSAFLLGVPVMVLLLVFGPVLLPEHRNPEPGPLDLTSLVMSLLAILPVVYGVKELAAGGTQSPTLPVLAMGLGITFGVAFARRQLRLEHPLLDLRLFRNRVFGATLASMLAAAAAMAGSFLLISQYVQSVLGLTPAQAGLWLLPTGLAIALGSQLAPVLSKRMRPATAISSGLAFGAVGFLLIALVHGTDGLVLVVVGIAVVHLGAGPLFALGTGMVMTSVPPERAGSAASMSEIANNLGGTLGLALLGTLGTAVYRTQIAGSLPAGVSEPAAHAAHETIGGATAAAGMSPPDIAADLLHSAGDAFVTGLDVAAVVAGVAFLALSVLVRAAHRAAGAPRQAAIGTSPEVGELAAAA
jgi:DHA2 family multidrug resistance protein-like MFS transporter